MKTELVLRYVLTQREANAIDDYINFLRRDPLPCTTCQAQAYGKCTGYNIFSMTRQENETCAPVVKWFYKSVERRRNFEYLDCEEIKDIITNRYLAELAKAESSQITSKILLAEHKVKEDESKIAISHSDESPDKLFDLGVKVVDGGDVK